MKTRNNTTEAENDFDAINKQIKFISQQRIEALLQVTGFEDIIKFYQNFFVAGYLATKKPNRPTWETPAPATAQGNAGPHWTFHQAYRALTG